MSAVFVSSLRAAVDQSPLWLGNMSTLLLGALLPSPGSCHGGLGTQRDFLTSKRDADLPRLMGPELGSVAYKKRDKF